MNLIIAITVHNIPGELAEDISPCMHVNYTIINADNTIVSVMCKFFGKGNLGATHIIVPGR